jgi:hypothetical protein
MFAAGIKGALQAVDKAGNRRNKKMKNHGQIFTEYTSLARACSPCRIANKNIRTDRHGLQSRASSIIIN